MHNMEVHIGIGETGGKKKPQMKSFMDYTF